MGMHFSSLLQLFYATSVSTFHPYQLSDKPYSSFLTVLQDKNKSAHLLTIVGEQVLLRLRVIIVSLRIWIRLKMYLMSLEVSGSM